MYIHKVKVNYLYNPTGIITLPQIGWIIESNNKNVKQIKYRMEVSLSESFDEKLWESGWIESEESAHVQLVGFELKAATKYYLRAMIIDNYGEVSEWSEVASFTTGIMDAFQWIGKFVSGETVQDALSSKGTYLRHEFDLNRKVKKAFIYSSALGLYQLHINGSKVGEGELTPGWTSYHKRLLYQTNDITDLLHEGKNAIGAHLGAGWYKGIMGFMKIRNNYGLMTGFIGQIHITYEDGSTEIIGTDVNWKATDSPVIFSEIYDGETYDARLEQEGWDQSAFDDGHWRQVDTIEYDVTHLEAQQGSLVKEIEAVKPIELIKTPKGEWVIDFGQNLSGWVEFKVSASAGEEVEIKCFEVLDEEGNAYFDNLRSAKQRVLYTCKGASEESYKPKFTFQGFRFAKIVSYPGVITLDNFIVYAVHSDMEPTGSFECSNPEINQLQSNILWGLKSNFVDVPTDCPQRDERLGWTGDAQIFCRTATHLVNTYTFFSKWLKDLAADQTPEGGVPHVIPDILDGKCEDNWLLKNSTHSAAAWGDAAVINPWVLYLTFGDKEIIYNQYESMKAWIEFMSNHSENGVWNYQVQFGDWVALDAEEGSYFGATPSDLTCTAYYAYSTQLFAKMAKIIGNEKDYIKYTALYNEIVKVFKDLFFDEEGTLTVPTQTAHVVALYFKLTPEEHIGKTANALVKLIEKENGHLVTGFVGTPYICHALSQNGKSKEAYDLLLKDDFPSWLYQVKMGATTIWEHWDGIRPDGSMWSANMNSFNHYAYGAIGEWLYRVVGGLEIDEDYPGYKHGIIAPMIGGDLTYAEVGYDSVYGAIVSRWEIDGVVGTLQVRIPHNTTSTICLDSSYSITDSDDLEFVKDGKTINATCGSGDYLIKFNTKVALLQKGQAMPKMT